MEPTPLDAAQVFDFIRESELAVIFVSVHRYHTFNGALSQRLVAEHPAIALGSLDLSALLLAGPSVLRFLHQGLRNCDGPAVFGVLPGYYLFRGGEMLAWDAGLPVFADVAALGRSALIGAVFSGIGNDLTLIAHALHVAADQVAADRLAWLFREAIASERTQRQTARETGSPPADELYWAYQVLGVLPTATDREVHDAWRKRRAETHPDHAGGDPVEFERRSRLSRDINHARDVIVNHRYPRTRGATHAWAS
jgi:DnaJ-like protein